MPSIPQPHPSTRHPLPPRPDPEALLLEAIQCRDAPLIRRLVPWWVHRRGLKALPTLLGRTLSPSESAETLAWIEAVTGSSLQPASVLGPWGADAPPADPPERRPSPRQLADQAVAAVDAAIAQLMAEFPAEALAGLPPRQALEVLDGLEGSPALAGLSLVEPPADLLRDPDFQAPLAGFPCPEGAEAPEPVASSQDAAVADGTAFRFQPTGGPVGFNGPLSFTIPQPEPAPASPLSAAAEPATAPGEEELIEEVDAAAAVEGPCPFPAGSRAGSGRSLGGRLIAPLRGRLGVRRLARRLIERVKEAGLVGREGLLAPTAWESPAEESTAGHPFPMTSALEAPAPVPPSTDAANAADGHDAGFEGTGLDQAALEGTPVAGTACEPWTTAIPAQAVAPEPSSAGPAPEAATIVSLGERLRERMRQSADLPSGVPHSDGGPAPRPAALADLGAWLPSSELPRAS